MAASRVPRDEHPNPVVRHGSSPAPAQFSPVRDDRASGGDTDGRSERWRRTARRGRDRFASGRAPTGQDLDPDLQEDVEAATGPPTARGRSQRVPADTVGPTLEGWPGPDLADELGTDAGDPLPGPEPGAYSAARRKLGKALVPGEKILVAQTRHPVVVLEPIISSLLVLLFIAAVSPDLGDLDLLRGFMMLIWLALAVRALWRWAHWANDYLVVTDRRLMRLHGIVDVQRDMMPLMKVTDMAFERPLLGRPLNYGKFVLESAGRDQALREITFVRRPDVVDAIIGRQIFAKPPFQSPQNPRK